MPNMSLQKHPMPEQQPDIRATNFKEVALGYTREIAMEEADRCLHCKNAPCVKGCPVNVPIPDFKRYRMFLRIRQALLTPAEDGE